MRLRITFTAPGPVFVPWSYQHYLQGLAYERMIEHNTALYEFLHDRGITDGVRQFRMFTFSKLFPARAKAVEKGLVMTPPIKWWVSTPVDFLVEALASRLLAEPLVHVGPAELEIIEAMVEPGLREREVQLFETLSPMAVSEGIVAEGGRLAKHYLDPEDEKFWQNVEENLRRKARAIGLPCAEDPLSFEPVGAWRSRLLHVQGARVKCYEGRFRARGNHHLLSLGYEVGFGERNSQGFGMVAVPPRPTNGRGDRRRRQVGRRQFDRQGDIT